MSRNSKIPGAARHSGALDSACAAVEHQLVRTVKHRHLEFQFGKPEHRQWRVELHRQRLLISSNPLLRPDAVIGEVAFKGQLSRSRAASRGGLSRITLKAPLSDFCSQRSVQTRKCIDRETQDAESKQTPFNSSSGFDLHNLEDGGAQAERY